MKVLFVASECAPVVKVGGLADVVGGLPKALRKQGVEVLIVIPRYGVVEIKSIKYTLKSIKVSYDGKDEEVKIYRTKLLNTDIDLYLLDNSTYLSSGSVYGDKSAVGSDLDFDRFSFFSKAVVEFLKLENEKLKINTIHCHDWHTSWIPLIAKKENINIKTLLTIHNLGRMYQGNCALDIAEKLGLSMSDIKFIPEINSNTSQMCAAKNQNERINILLQGIANADLINTVSPEYAKEILTSEYDEGLQEGLMAVKEKIYGVLNGIDYAVWDPRTDDKITSKFPSPDSNFQSTIEAKRKNKINLLNSVFALPPTSSCFLSAPVFGMITRVTEQKGFDILLPALESILPNFDIKVIILGLGDKTYEQKTKNLEQKFPKKLKFLDRFDDDIAHLIYAGSDFLLVPSRFEPCGLTQLIAMRYGTLPLVRKTGGLANSVEEGVTGFMFGDYAAKALRDKMEEAISVFQVSQIAMEKMINHAMRKDFSWEKTAGEYVALYNQLSAV